MHNPFSTGLPENRRRLQEIQQVTTGDYSDAKLAILQKAKHVHM